MISRVLDHVHKSFINQIIDCIWRLSFLMRLRKAGCTRNIYDLVRDYLQNRSINTTSENQEVKIDVERGWLRGSVLGTTIMEYNIRWSIRNFRTIIWRKLKETGVKKTGRCFYKNGSELVWRVLFDWVDGRQKWLRWREKGNLIRMERRLWK